MEPRHPMQRLTDADPVERIAARARYGLITEEEARDTPNLTAEQRDRLAKLLDEE